MIRRDRTEAKDTICVVIDLWQTTTSVRRLQGIGRQHKKGQQGPYKVVFKYHGLNQERSTAKGEGWSLRIELPVSRHQADHSVQAVHPTTEVSKHCTEQSTLVQDFY